MARPRRAIGATGQLEAAHQHAVMEYAGLCGWRSYHPPDNRPSGNTGRVQRVAAGFPDLTLVRGPRLVFAELKSETGRIAPAQEEWLAALMGVRDAIASAIGGHPDPWALANGAPSLEVYVWRPSDWPEIQRVLARA